MPKKKKPLVLSGSSPVFFDVDDTLIFWSTPADYEGLTVLIDEYNSFSRIHTRKRFAVNTAMVDRLRFHAESGYHVIVWSQGGFQWAHAVVKALGLEEHVAIIMDKPTVLYDDLGYSAWLPAPGLVLPPGWSQKMGGVFWTGLPEDFAACEVCGSFGHFTQEHQSLEGDPDAK